MANCTKEDVAGWFSISEEDLKGVKLIFGYYTYEDYSGDAYVVFERDGKLWEVSGGHCSCYGLDGQWEPEETLVEAIEKRYDNGYGYGRGAHKDELQVALEKWKKNVARRTSKK